MINNIIAFLLLPILLILTIQILYTISFFIYLIVITLLKYVKIIQKRL
jgi:hypothetical protein